jgi:hypothetical protein
LEGSLEVGEILKYTNENQIPFQYRFRSII